MSPVLLCASCTVATPDSPRDRIASASARAKLRITTGFITWAPSRQLRSDLRVDPLKRLGVLDSFSASVAHRLHAAALAEIRVIFPQVRLRFHRFHGFVLGLPHR